MKVIMEGTDLKGTVSMTLYNVTVAWNDETTSVYSHKSFEQLVAEGRLIVRDLNPHQIGKGYSKEM